MLPRTVLLIVSFLDMLCIGLLVPQLGNHALQLGFTQIVIGIMGTFYSAFQLISEPMVGSLSDLKGRKPILFISFIVCGSAYLLLGITTSIIMFFIIRCILGITKQTQLLIKALAPDYESKPDQQAVIFGRLATSSGISFAIGPPIGGHIMQAFPDKGFTIIAVIVFIIYTTNAGLIKCLPDIKGGEKDNKKNGKHAVSPKLAESIINSSKQTLAQLHDVDWAVYWNIFAFKLLISLAMGMYFSNYALFLKTQLDVPPMYLGYIISLQGVVGAASSYFIGFINQFYVNDKDFSKRVYHIFLLLTTALLGMANAPSISLYILCVLPFSLSSSVSRIVSLEMIMSKGDSDRRGSVIGVMGTVRSVSGVVTPLLAGFVGEYLGIRWLGYLAGGSHAGFLPEAPTRDATVLVPGAFAHLAPLIVLLDSLDFSTYISANDK